MFLVNRYKRVYDALVMRALTRTSLEGYKERHHVLPKALGGSNKKSNIVLLTAREHYVAHLCLVRCTIGDARFKMICAAKQIAKCSKGLHVNSRIYESLRKEHAKEMSLRRTGMKFSDQHRANLSQSHMGYVMPAAQRAKISQSLRGKNFTEERRRNISQGLFGRAITDETRQKMRDSHIGKSPSDETRAKQRLSKLGKPKSYETRRRMSEARKKLWESGVYNKRKVV